jgi:hypothetical protein
MAKKTPKKPKKASRPAPACKTKLVPKRKKNPVPARAKKATPVLRVQLPQDFPPKVLSGDLWWKDEDGDSAPANVRELKLFADRLYLDFEQDGYRFRAALPRQGTTGRFAGSFTFADNANWVLEAGTVKASCTIHKEGAIYVLEGTWDQSDTGLWEWHAELE